jgi:hypothetical protein
VCFLLEVLALPPGEAGQEGIVAYECSPHSSNKNVLKKYVAQKLVIFSRFHVEIGLASSQQVMTSNS